MDITKCTEIIEKIAENHVIVKQMLYDSEGVEVEVSREEYGQNRIDSEKQKAESEFKIWEDIKKDLKILDDKILYAQEKVNKADLIQLEMDKELNLEEQ